MITVRTLDGKSKQLSLHPPLRLCNSPKPGCPSGLPGDVIRRILLFLPYQSVDWLAADSCCRTWREAAMPLWNGKRTEMVTYYACRPRIIRKWQKLIGFLESPVVRSLNGPATKEEIRKLQQLITPWKVPVSLLVSLELHNGQQHGSGGGMRSPGFYLGARLLSVQEIMETLQHWRTNAPIQQPQDDDEDIMVIPLFSESGARQIAMELQQRNTNTSGRIVLVSAIAPWAPHFRVLAQSWDDFLTLI